MHHLIVPVRAQLTDQEDGRKRIVLSVNGRPGLVLDYDPKAGTIESVPLNDEPTPGCHPLSGLETK